MPGRTDSRRRLVVLLLGLVVVSGALMARLAWWQVAERDMLAAQAVRQTTTREEIPSRRGSIYDRSGTVLLATTVDRDRLVGAPDQLTPAERLSTAAQLNAILGLAGTAADDLTQKMASGRPYVILAHGLDHPASDAIHAAVSSGTVSEVFLEPEPQRVYPQAGGAPSTTLAAKLIGFVNRDGAGQYGVEQRYQDLLAGLPTVLAGQPSTGTLNPEGPEVIQPGVPGTDLRLTIDARLQLALEQEVMAAWLADRAVTVSSVVMDPYSGEVYAEGSYPSYDENDYGAIATDDPGRFVDPVVSQVYEPGSVFKMLTVVAGLESGTVTPTTRLMDEKVLHLDGGRAQVMNANHASMGLMTLRDAVAWSRNVVLAKVAMGLAPSTRAAASELFDVWGQLGIGQPTGIDLAGEVGGLVHDPSVRPWRQIDLANAAFGQGVAVTPIQLATAYAAMMNGGQLVQPHVVAAAGQSAVAPASSGQVIPASMSSTLISMMHHVVTTVPFYRNGSLIPGYYVGGKTGTAQIWDPKLRHGLGDWKQNIFNYSFIGFVGRKTGRPDLVIAVQIHEAQPRFNARGSLILPVESFQLFRRIATDAMSIPSLLPDLSARSSQPVSSPASSPAPSLSGPSATTAAESP